MGLDKAILHGKERRRPYTGAKAIDRTCRIMVAVNGAGTTGRTRAGGRWRRRGGI